MSTEGQLQTNYTSKSDKTRLQGLEGRQGAPSSFPHIHSEEALSGKQRVYELNTLSKQILQNKSAINQGWPLPQGGCLGLF